MHFFYPGKEVEGEDKEGGALALAGPLVFFFTWSPGAMQVRG